VYLTKISRQSSKSNSGRYGDRETDFWNVSEISFFSAALPLERVSKS